MLNTILLIVLIAAGTLIPLVLAWVSPKFREWIKAKIANEKVEGILLRLEGFVEKVVVELDQTIVDQLKKDGKWNAEEAAKVKALALEKVKSYLGEAGVKEAMAILGLTSPLLEQLLITLIEAAVRDNKA
jgi:hypothetical protein